MAMWIHAVDVGTNTEWEEGVKIQALCYSFCLWLWARYWNLGPGFLAPKAEPNRSSQVSLAVPVFVLCVSLIMNRLHWLSYRWYVSWFTNTAWQMPPEITPIRRRRRLPSIYANTASIFTLSTITVKLRNAIYASRMVGLKPRLEYLPVAGGDSYTNQEDTCSPSGHVFPKKFIQHFEFCSL